MNEPIDQATKDLIEGVAQLVAAFSPFLTQNKHRPEIERNIAKSIQSFLEEKLKQERNKALEAIEALEQIAYPIKHLQELADQEMSKLNGMMAIMVTNDPNYGRQIAIKALESLKDKSHE